MSRKVQTKITEQELQWAFRQWSNDGNIISLQTMKQMLTDFGTEDKRLTHDEADDLLLSFPELKRGTFDWEKFLKSIL
jgi:Ca2+-binding EF-hand superfamily protein